MTFELKFNILCLAQANDVNPNKMEAECMAHGSNGI